MKRKFAFCLRLILLGALSVIAGYLLLVLAYCLPVAPMADNIKGLERLAAFDADYPDVMGPYSGSTLDKSTDALMLLMATEENSGSPFISSLMNRLPAAAGMSPRELLWEKYAHGAPPQPLSTESYARYWHGYLVLLKPLLLLFSFGQLQYLNMCLQIGLLAALCFFLRARAHSAFIVPVVMTYLFLNPICTVLSIQFSAMTILMLAECLLLMVFEKRFEDRQKLLTAFFLFGITAVYLDLLTFPLITVGIPALLWALTHRPGGKDGIRVFLACAALWCLGYAAMWASKWLLVYLITGEDMTKEVLEVAAYRSGIIKEAGIFSYSDVLRRQFDQCKLQGCVVASVLLAQLIMAKRPYANKAVTIAPAQLAEIAIAAAMPFAWYFLLRNHSYVHYWFTYRELALTIFSLTALVPASNRDTRFTL